MLKNWRLSAIAAFSLAIAMALGVVSFSISNAILLRAPLAENPRELLSIFTNTPKERFQFISYPDYLTYRDHSRSFLDVAAYPNSIGIYAATFEGRIVIVTTCPISDNYLSVMGIHPLMGRFFEKGDDDKRSPVIVLTYAGWRRFNFDPHIVGKQIVYGHDPVTIIGVAPKDFKGAAFGFEPDVIRHFDINDDDRRRDNRRLILLGRLQHGVSREQARAEVRGLSQQLAREYPAEDKDRIADVLPAGALPPGDAQDAHLISELLVIAIFFILLIACANAANLLLAIATERRREALIKLALGASRARLIRDFLLETGILSLFSAVAAFALAALVIGKFSEFETRLPGFGSLRIGADLHLDGAVLATSALMVLIAWGAAGIAPAVYGSSANLASALSGEAVIGGTKKGVIRNGLVIVQVAVSTLVLIGVALSFRSLENLRSVDPGFSARNLAGLLVGSDARELEETKARAFYETLRRSASSVRGIEGVTLAGGMPMQLGGAGGDVRGNAASQQTLRVRGGVVDADYFSTVGIRLLSGRTFDDSDRGKSPEVVIVSKELAKKLWPNADPVGRTLHIGNGSRAAKVIGIAADVKVMDFDEAPQPFMYLALMQHPQPYITVIARTAGDPRSYTEPLARAVMTLDVHLPVPPTTIQDVFDIAVITEIWTFEAISIVSAIAVLLAVLGLFGAVSYSVGERKRELGIRVALGALPWHLLRMVLRNTLGVAGCGTVIGTALGMLATIALRSQFYGLSRVEWLPIAGGTAGMLAIAGIIGCLAAWRATHLDPMEVLRHN